MQNLSIAIVAIVLYIGASIRIATPTGLPSIASLNPKHQVIALLVGAVVAHAIVLVSTIFAERGIHLGVFDAGSLAAWCVGASLLVIMLRRPLDNLAVVIFPAVAIMLALGLLFPSNTVFFANPAAGIRLHVGLALIAYGLFAIATVQALYIGIADFKLRQHRPSMQFIPPLPTMEKLLFQLTGTAFVLLTISLILGAIYIADVRAQHLSHKIVFSLLAWSVFATLIIGRWRLGWRGRRAIKFVVIGFVLLAVGFFGSKVVLELILHRV